MTFTPTAKIGWWNAHGNGSLKGLFLRVFPRRMASPTGFVDWHQHCSDRCRARATRQRLAREMHDAIARLMKVIGV